MGGPAGVPPILSDSNVDWGQEQGLRSGTLSPALCTGFGVAAALAQSRATQAWEYEETRWVALADLAAFDRAHSGEIIITTRAAFRGLGWVE